MLTRAVKPSCEVLHNAVKQLLWAISAKSNFSTSSKLDDDESVENKGFDRRENRKNFDIDSTFSYSRSRKYRDQDDDFDSFNNRRNFRSKYDRYSERRETWGAKRSWRDSEDNFGRFSKYGSRRSSVLDNLDQIKESSFDEEHTPMNKDFYKPHPDFQNRSNEEAEEFRKKHNFYVFGNRKDLCPPPILSFDELNLPPSVSKVFEKLNLVTPTPIQSQTWPIVLKGFNMVGISQTGSGKTLGFALPALLHVQAQSRVPRNEGPVALIISPTRELVQQIMSVVSTFAKAMSLRVSCLYGGSSKNLQIASFRNGVDICVATPGRLIDVLNTGFVNLSRCTYCVLDEADRLLDMGFHPQIEAVMKMSRKEKQVSMWSATWPEEVQDLAREFLRDYIAVRFGSTKLMANPNITQKVLVCESRERANLLYKILDDLDLGPNNKVIIFANTKSMVDVIGRALKQNGFRVGTIHSDKTQANRTETLSRFREGSIHILVGSLVVGRGLDIDDINYIINFDCPKTIEDYVHIIGRTARKGNTGTSYLFLSPEDQKMARGILKILQDSKQTISPELLSLANDYPPSRKRRSSF